MEDPQIRFDDGAAYEEFMGVWSRCAGDVFLPWLAAAAGQRWVDVEASRLDVLRELWSGAGLIDIETRAIVVERTFADFDTFWRIARTGPRLAPRLAAMPADSVALLRDRLRARLAPDAGGRITCSARANAIKGKSAVGEQRPIPASASGPA